MEHKNKDNKTLFLALYFHTYIPRDLTTTDTKRKLNL
jgi:hypothetical protein